MMTLNKIRRSSLTWIIIILPAIFMFAYCSSGSREIDPVSRQYADKIEIKITLGSADNLHDLNKEDVFYSITNHGDKTVTKIYGEIVFHDQDGEEVGRDSILFLEENKNLEGIAVEDKKARWRSLAPGQTIRDSYEFIYLLGGDPDLREELRQRWSELSASAVIKKINI